MDIHILVIPDPDEWVQQGRPPYVIAIPDSKMGDFGDLVLSKDGGYIREWLRLNGIRLIDGIPLQDIDYVVCHWG